jgi:ADP-ribose pyrophosphatase YjhB (NUDIX family)
MEWYHNVAAAVAGFVEYDNQLLLTRRRYPPAEGELDLPGGFADPYETAEEALRREVAEELNLHLGPLLYLGSAHNRYPFKTITYHTLDSFFVGQALGIESITAADDISAYEWWPIQELGPHLFPFPSMAAGLALYLAHKKHATPK